MIVVSVIGYQDSGKTTLIEELVPTLATYGRVGTVKSIHHDVEIDTPGTDTYRHRSAGAQAVIGITPSLRFSIMRDEREKSESLHRTLTSLAADGFDFVLVEGFKESNLPYIALGEAGDREFPGHCLECIPTGSSPDPDELATRIRRLDSWNA